MKDKPRTKINFYVPKKEKQNLLDQISELMVHLDLSMSKIIRIAIKEKHEQLQKTLIRRYLPRITAKHFPNAKELKIIEEVIIHE